MSYLTKQDIASTAMFSTRKAAKILGVGKTSVSKYRGIYGKQEAIDLPAARILTLDIESQPGIYYSWGPKAEWLASQFEIEPPKMMCFAAKWLGETEVFFYRGGQAIYEVHRLLSEADIVVTYNGDQYDLKRINTEFLKAGLLPPKPYKSIDLIKTNRKQFQLPYLKLDYLAKAVGIEGKLETGGFALWQGCMAGDPEAWALMEEYNKGDVTLTESLYIKLLPWLHNVPHMGMFATDGGLCPYCASNDLKRDGETHTTVQVYPLYNCNNCGGWSRGNKPILDPIKTRRAA